MNILKRTLFIALFASVLIISCKPVHISKEDLLGKRFAKIAFSMGSEYLEFSNENKVSYVILNKLSYGYNGKYDFELVEGKQIVKISINEGELILRFLIKSKTKLELVSAVPKNYKSFDFREGTIFELDN